MMRTVAGILMICGSPNACITWAGTCLIISGIVSTIFGIYKAN